MSWFWRFGEVQTDAQRTPGENLYVDVGLALITVFPMWREYTDIGQRSFAVSRCHWLCVHDPSMTLTQFCVLYILEDRVILKSVYETLPQCLGVVGDSLGSRHCCANIHLLTYLLTTPWSSQGRNTRTKCFIFIIDKWRFGYIQRLQDFRRTKQVFQWISDEKRSRGLPRITWWDIIWRDTEPMDTAWKDVCLKALDMDEWKEWAAWCASHWIWMD